MSATAQGLATAVFVPILPKGWDLIRRARQIGGMICVADCRSMGVVAGFTAAGFGLMVAIMSESERRAPEAAVEFGSVLARLREQRGVNQKELARTIGRSPSTISRLESSGRGVSRDLVDELADALRATPAERLDLLRAAGFLSEETVAMLEEPDLTRLSRLLAQPTIHPRDRRLLLRYVELALEHAAALGYAIPSAWPTDER